MPDPRHAHCPECAGGRVNCPRCDGEGIVTVSIEDARECFRLLLVADRAGVFGKCTTDPCPECSAMEALQAAILAVEDD